MKNELSQPGIFDIHDWGQIINLNALLGQINLAEQLQEKINLFKKEFIFSHSYTYEELLKNDDVCWFIFKYIPKNFNISEKFFKGIKYHFEGVYKGNVIIGTGLPIKPKDLLPQMNDRYIEGDSYYSFKDWCANSYRIVSTLNEDDFIIKKLFLQKVYNGYTTSSLNKIYHITSDKDIVLHYPGSGIDEENLLSRLDDWELKNSSSYYRILQEPIIDSLGGSSFIEKLRSYTDDSINKIRSNELKFLNSHDKERRYILNKYNQPIYINSSTDNSILIPGKNMLSIVLHDRNNQSVYRDYSNYFKLDFSGTTGKLIQISEESTCGCSTEDIKNYKGWRTIANLK